jgi:hypothetical protein
MVTKRERKHRRVEVSGHVMLDELLPGWEVALVVAALIRLHCGRSTPAAEGIDAAR